MAGLDHVATVLTELSDRISPRALLSAARKEPDLSTVQRTGYLLDKFGSVAVTGPLAKWLSGREARFVPLRPERKPTAQERDLKWRLIVNAEVEPDI